MLPAVKRILDGLPWVGLALLVATLAVRALRVEGLDLPGFPRPPVVTLPEEVVPVGTARLAGRVTGVDGEPLPESLVLVDHEGELAWDYCDPRGNFSIERLPAGRLRVSVLAREHEAEVLWVEAPGEGLEVVMDRPLPETPVLPELGEGPLEGQVVAAMAGRGWAGYELQLVPVDPPETLGAPVPVSTTIGADRRFAFERLLHGRYRARVVPPWARGGSWPDLVDPAGAEFVHGPSRRGLEVPLLTGEIAGELIDPGGEFVEGALVRVSPGGERDRPWRPESSGPSGRFLVRDLPPGSYELSVDAGEAHFAERVEVLPGVTSVVDVPPLELRRESRSGMGTAPGPRRER